MTTSGDGDSTVDLAPVTPLFGRRGASKPSAGGSAPQDEWADAAPSDDEVGHVSTADDDAAEPTSHGVDDVSRFASTRSEPELESGHESASARARKRKPASVPAESDAVRSTAAALAAITEHWSGPRAVDALDTVDDDDEPEPEPEGLDAQRSRAENISMHALARRGVSSAEMSSLLAARDLDEQVVSDEVERLEGVGLLNDRELAENLVRSKHERKGLGRGAVTSELRSRGIAPELIEQAMSEIDDDDEQSRADEWALKRATSLQGLDQATAERRLNGYLMRRGYRSETIRRAVEKALPRGRGGVRFR